MQRRLSLALAGAAVMLCAAGVAAQTGAAGIACTPQAPVAKRASPYDSVTFKVGGATSRICYSRPSLRGRHMIGGQAVPYGKLWRTGANEPTTLHVPVAATIAGLRVAPGSYSIYTVPGEKTWTVIVNRATAQWGIESDYTAAIAKQEVGRATVPAETVPGAIEMFTIRATPAGSGADVVLEWEHSRIHIPIKPAGA